MARAMTRRIALLAVALGTAWLALGVRGHADETENVPEPPGFWTGEMRGPVPATIAGGSVIEIEELAALVESGAAVLVDVGPPPRRPDDLPAESVWLPPPHRSLPGAVWLPGVGGDEIDDAHDDWFRARLAAFTGGDPARPVVLFCHPNCWASWNAARRAILYGYSQVYWYPGGIEGWQDSDRPTAAVEAEAPP